MRVNLTLQQLEAFEKVATLGSFRAAALALLVLFLSFTVFAGAVCVISLQRGLSSYQNRLGADIVVIPNSAKGHGTVDDILLQGMADRFHLLPYGLALVLIMLYRPAGLWPAPRHEDRPDASGDRLEKPVGVVQA